MGLLAAAAVACSKTLATLPAVMVEIVRIAFRTGTLVSRVSRQLQQPGHSKESWAMIVYDVTESAATEALDDYYASKVRSSCSQPQAPAPTPAASYHVPAPSELIDTTARPHVGQGIYQRC